VTWLTRIPLWAKVAVPSVIVAVVLCNLIGQPDNPPNPYADSLASTRTAYAADTTRLLRTLIELRVAGDVARDSALRARNRQAAAEHRLARLTLSVDSARTAVIVADSGTDSAAMIRARDVVIAHQSAAITDAVSALMESHTAFDRLTEAYTAANRRADSAEAGWARTRLRLGIADSALAIEQRRTSCTWNLVLKRVECPSRGIIAVVSAVGAVLVYSQFQRGK